jgi:transcriptional regulator with XRE-family HTH domain
MAAGDRIKWRNLTTGERIKEARKRAGMTQEDLANKLGIPYQSISQWERGTRKPKYGTLKKLADALDVWVYDLSSPEDTEERINRLNDFFEDGGLSCPEPPPEEYQRITAALDKLNRSGRQKAVERVEELTEIPRYRAETPPQSPPVPQEGTDTTPPPEGAEGPQEGE